MANAAADKPERSLGRALSVFLDRRIAVMLGLGFGSGLPNFLIFDTMSAWLRAAGLALTVISLFSLATLPYSFKFLWAPLVDRTAVPGLTRWLGHRRSWMLVTQAAIVVGLLLISACDPKSSLGLLALVAALTGFAGATQDIVVDAWRIEAAEMARQGAMSAAYQWGYRVANIVAGAAPLFLADAIGWRVAYASMAAVMCLPLVATLLAPAEQEHVIRPIHAGDLPRRPAVEAIEWAVRLILLAFAALLLGSGLGARPDILAMGLAALGEPDAAKGLTALWTAKATGAWLQLASVVAGFGVIAIATLPIPRLPTRPGVFLFHAIWDPLVDFFRRFGRLGILILALICLYRLSDFVLNIMNAFYQDLGFSLTEIAEVRKVFGVAASMFGVFVGGLSVARLGVMRSLLIGAFALPITNTIFGWLAVQGPSMTALFTAIGVDNVVSSYAGTCLIAYMSGLTSAGFTATQYALFSSLYSLPGKVIASQSGRIVEAAARAAHAGGPFAPLTTLFAHAPAGAFAQAMAKSHVAPAELGAGYVVFFLYAGLVGVASMALAVAVFRLQPRTATAT